MSLSKFGSERQVIEDLIVGHITQNAHLYLPKPDPVDEFRARFKQQRTNYEETPWGRMLTDPSTLDPMASNFTCVFDFFGTCSTI